MQSIVLILLVTLPSQVFAGLPPGPDQMVLQMKNEKVYRAMAKYKDKTVIRKFKLQDREMQKLPKLLEGRMERHKELLHARRDAMIEAVKEQEYVHEYGKHPWGWDSALLDSEDIREQKVAAALEAGETPKLFDAAEAITERLYTRQLRMHRNKAPNIRLALKGREGRYNADLALTGNETMEIDMCGRLKQKETDSNAVTTTRKPTKKFSRIKRKAGLTMDIASQLRKKSKHDDGDQLVQALPDTVSIPYAALVGFCMSSGVAFASTRTKTPLLAV